MTKILRFFERIVLHFVKFLIVPIEFFHPRLYMDIYIKLLRYLGMNIYGKPRYISSRAYFDDLNLITIGDRVVVSMYVDFLTHDYSITTALIANDMTPATDAVIRRPIVIGNNVFIGINTLVMPGATIGDNVIIGGGSVVRGNVPPNSIMLGNPAICVGDITESSERLRERLSDDRISFDAF